MTYPLDSSSQTQHSSDCVVTEVARQGAGAVYLNAHHPDIMSFLDTKRENADEKIRIKTLSLGVVIPDITFELAQKNDDMYLFSPYDVERVYGKPFGEISITEKYHEMVENPDIRKKKINARHFFQTLAEIQFESGYPYIMFEDTVNETTTLKTQWINKSNLCVTGDTLIHTSKGLMSAEEAFETKEDFDVVADKRAKYMTLDKDYGVELTKSTPMHKTAENAEVFTLKTLEGYEISATAWHKFYVKREGEFIKIPLGSVIEGDKVLIQSGEGAYGPVQKPDLAYLVGAFVTNGAFKYSKNGDLVAKWYTHGERAKFNNNVMSAAMQVLKDRENAGLESLTLTLDFSGDYSDLSSTFLTSALAEEGVTRDTKYVIPRFVIRGDKATQEAYIRGAFQMGGMVVGSEATKSCSIELGSSSREFLVSLQKLLINMGIYSRIYKSRVESQVVYNLRVRASDSRKELFDLVGTWTDSQHARWDTLCKGREVYTNTPFHKYTATVASVEHKGFEDVYDVTVNDGHSLVFNGIATGNCSEILQVSEHSELNADLSYKHLGEDISCNLGSLNIALTMDSPDFAKTIETAVRALTSVSTQSNIESVPTIKNGNDKAHAIGLGQMNLHGYLGREHIYYGSEEGLDFTNAYFAAVMYQCLKASTKIAQERGETFDQFEKSEYASGAFFDRYDPRDFKPRTDKIKKLFKKSSIHTPTIKEWEELKAEVMEHGIFNRYLQAVPPTGSISYINNSTSSIHPIASKIEIRKEGKIGRVYYPAPHMDNDNLDYYQDAYEVGYKKIIDTYAEATKYVDQGLSLTLFFKDTATTRDINRAQIYAWRKGIKTIYYIRLRQLALEGTQVEGCVSCML